jgi:hypothetical protein
MGLLLLLVFYRGGSDVQTWKEPKVETRQGRCIERAGRVDRLLGICFQCISNSSLVASARPG